jgi:hypothetical protein
MAACDVFIHGTGFDENLKSFRGIKSMFCIREANLILNKIEF